MLQLLPSDSGLDDTIQVPFNVFLLLDGKKQALFPALSLPGWVVSSAQASSASLHDRRGVIFASAFRGLLV